jgi:hypothetical protein
VLILTAAAFILAKPIIDNSNNTDADNVVMIIDASASMHTEAGGTTRFKRAVTKMTTDAEEAFKNESKVSVIIASETSQFLIQEANAENSHELFAELNKLTQSPEDYYTYGTPDIKGAVDLAEQITGVNKNVAVTLYTDTTYYETGRVNVWDAKSEEITEWNAAILDVRAILVDNYYRIEIDVASYGEDANVDIECQILGANNDGKDNAGENKNLEANAICTGDQITTIVFAHIPTEAEGGMSDAEKALITEEVSVYSYDQIYVTITEDDDLSYDNTFYLYGGTKPTIKVLYYSTLPNNYFTSALLVAQDAMKDSWNVEITEIREGDPVIQGYDFYIFEHNMPKTMPDDGVVFCVNPKTLPSSSGVRLGALASSSSGKEVFFNNSEEVHPILNNVIGSAISVTQFREVISADGFTTLLTVKDFPMLLVKNEIDSKMVLMPFSLHYSNLAVVPEFPLILMNTMSYFFPSTVGEYVFDVGESVELNARANELEISVPFGPNPEPVQTFPTKYPVKVPGTHTFTQYPISGIPSIDSIYVKIPDDESNINLTEETLVNPYFYTDADDLNIDLLFYFALAMVALLFIEWWLKSREQI